MPSQLNDELKFEIADVRSAIRALQRRVDKIEELGSVSFAPKAETAPWLMSQPDHHARQTVPEISAAMDARPAGPFIHEDRPAKIYSDAMPTAKRLKEVPVNQGLLNSPAALNKQQEVTANETSFIHPKSGEGWEVFVGRHLNKIGIAFLVIGCALALLYQFQYFSPLLKVLSGILGGALLIFGGERFEKNNPALAWYGRALIGGGWALSYFSIFAAHNFDSVRIISSATVDVVLLLAVAGGAVCHSLKYQSQTITGITLTLAFLTICLSPASSFSMLACALLVAALSALALKLKWFNLLVYGECVLYGVYLTFILPQIMSGNNAIFGMSAAEGNYFTGLAFSTFCWLALNLVIFTLKARDKSQCDRLVVATLINSFAYLPTALFLMTADHPEMRFGFMLSVGLAYLMSSTSANRKDMPAVNSLHTLLGVFLLTLAVPFKLTDEWISAFWSLEVPLLVWAGFRYEMPWLRQFAMVMACLSTFMLCATNCYASFNLSPGNHSLIFSIVAIASLAVSAVVYRRRLDADASHQNSFYLFFGLATALGAATTYAHVHSNWLALAYTLESAAIILLGLRLKDQLLPIVGGVGVYALSLGVFINTIDTSARISNVLMSAVLYYLANKYRGRENPTAQLGYLAAATFVGTALLAQVLHGAQFAAAVMLEALCLLGIGFYKQDKVTRLVAFCLSTLVTVGFVVGFLHNIDPIVLLNVSIRTNILVGIIFGSGLSLAAACYLSPRLRSITGEAWTTGFYAYGGLTAMVIVMLTLHEIPQHFMALALCIECITTIAIGYLSNLEPLRALGTIGLFGTQSVCLTMTSGHWAVSPTVAIILLQYTLTYLYTRIKEGLRAEFEHGIEHFYGVTGTLITALLMAQIVPSHWLSVAWTILGVAILSIGFKIKDKVYRVSGLSILGVVILRLLFVELASLETIYRIISFIAAGVVLLFASLAYARFNSPLEQKTLPGS